MDHRDHKRRLKARGAVRVTADGKPMPVIAASRTTTADLPSALDRWENLAEALKAKTPVIFLDYDGTLTPIVERPEGALLSTAMTATLTRLAARCAVAVISGRDLKDVQKRVGIDRLAYAGSHGFEIAGPQRQRVESANDLDALPTLDAAEDELRYLLQDISGAEVERKRFSIAVHFRRVADEKTDAVEKAIEDVLKAHAGLRKGYGKKVFELQPDVDRDKGKAVRRILKILGYPDAGAVMPIYIGDDTTDEDAFRELSADGIGIVVHANDPKPTHARYVLADPSEVEEFLKRLAGVLE